MDCWGVSENHTISLMLCSSQTLLDKWFCSLLRMAVRGSVSCLVTLRAKLWIIARDEDTRVTDHRVEGITHHHLQRSFYLDTTESIRSKEFFAFTRHVWVFPLEQMNHHVCIVFANVIAIILSQSIAKGTKPKHKENKFLHDKLSWDFRVWGLL